MTEVSNQKKEALIQFMYWWYGNRKDATEISIDDIENYCELTNPFPLSSPSVEGERKTKEQLANLEIDAGLIAQWAVNNRYLNMGDQVYFDTIKNKLISLLFASQFLPPANKEV